VATPSNAADASMENPEMLILNGKCFPTHTKNVREKFTNTDSYLTVKKVNNY